MDSYSRLALLFFTGWNGKKKVGERSMGDLMAACRTRKHKVTK